VGKVELTANWDRAAEREWLSYFFWTPEAFAANHGISVRQLRNLMRQGLPCHGKPHRGVPGSGIRLGVAAVKWLREYRRVTAEGHFRGTRCLMALDEGEGRHFDDQMAYAKLYGGTEPHDDWLESRAGGAERRSWAKKFKEIQTATAAVPDY
jgi:hypothetical protein